MSSYEDWRREQEAKLDDEAKHRARVGRMNDADFSRYAAEEISRSEAAMRRNPQPPKPEPGVVRDDGSLNKLTDGQYRDHLASIGINVGVQWEETLTDSMARERKRRGME